ncbi:MAG: DNA topoisomerase IV subunit A [Candidatus Thorarchaeota archaeon]|nr:DNA topoisomerase IV subunit A [Candidatus Thorarchaeota archaeon]
MNDSNRASIKLTDLGKQIVESILADRFPVLEIPDRNTSNIVYNAKQNRFVLGDSTNIRDSSNINHIRSFTQLTWVASFAKQLLAASRTSSLRDLYYSSEAFDVVFKDQAESDRIVTDLECVTGLPRESFGIFPDEHSSIYGELVMRYTVPGYDGREIDLTISPDGLPIGPALMTAEPIRTDAEIVLAVESGGMFSRLIETKAWQRFKAVLIQLGGQPPRATRSLIRTLNERLDLPVYLFTDGDPWGMHIARVIMSGSANSAHIENLTTPGAVWIGVTPKDIVSYSLPTEKMNNADLKRLDELSRDVRYSDHEWQKHIEEFRKLREKAEQQAFSRYGMDFVVDTYLSDKII